MPQRSLYIEAFFKKLIDECESEDKDEYISAMLECPALSLEFLEPLLKTINASPRELCRNRNIPWQYFEHHMNEILDEDWESLTINSEFPEEFYRQHLDRVSRSWENIFIVREEFSREFLTELVERNPEFKYQAAQMEWSNKRHSLTDIRAKLHELRDFPIEKRLRQHIEIGLARNPNITVEFVKECQDQLGQDDEFIELLFGYCKNLPWSFLEENLPYIRSKRAPMRDLQSNAQLSWDFLVQHPELIMLDSDARNSAPFQFDLEELVMNDTMTDEFAEKYLQDFARLGLVELMAMNEGLSLAFFQRHLDFIVDNDGASGLCENSSLPLFFFEENSDILNFDALTRNSFTYQFKIENGFEEEELIYNAQIAIEEEGTPTNLPRLMLNVMRDQHEKMINRGYHR